jgi:2,3-bisphosphoglycerate-independent phosphoglycerate mutase
MGGAPRRRPEKAHMDKRRTILLILDGWGHREDRDGNAVLLARTPHMDRLMETYPHTLLNASGEFVGLPHGQMGNSEVGHLNLGAGRVVYQDIMRISKSIDDGTFFENPVLVEAVEAVRERGSLHLMGLLSPGGVHSLQKHLYALIDMAKRHRVGNVSIHAILDGRDTPPRSGLSFLEELDAHLRQNGIGRVATVMGRYYCMDRDNRWDRVEKAYDAMTLGAGVHAADHLAALRDSYARDVTDEFVDPIVVVDEAGRPVDTVKDGDSIIFFNFRADRAREITRAFTEEPFDQFPRQSRPAVHFACMTMYDERFALPAAFPPDNPHNILAEAAAARGMKTLRIAETEKYAHVTFFFNGGREKEYPGEKRILIPSPRVATYDLKPDMNAFEVARTLVAELANGAADYVICNFANPDMVGHTGILEAAIKAVETVDTCVGTVVSSLDLDRDVAIITADHGNAEQMIDYENGGPHTAHTTNLVPCVLLDNRYRGGLLDGGALRDISPTICGYLGIDPPEEMTGTDLRIDL